MRQKNTFLWPALTMATLTVAACDDGDTEENGTKGEPVASAEPATPAATDQANEAEPSKPEPAKTCQLQSFHFEIGGQARQMELEHDEEGRVVTVHAKRNDREDELAYEYDEEGRLAGVKGAGKSALSYEYDGDRLKAIRGKGSFNDRVMEHDEQGRVVKVVTLFRGKPYQTNEYEYGDGECPARMTVTNRKGKLVEEHAYEYDDQVNPLAGLSAMANALELTEGPPVANCPHNMVALKRTWKTRTSYKINGERKKPGDTMTQRMALEYNEWGYPVSRGQVQDTDASDEAPAKGKESQPVERYSYECA
jgi:YD repeat-containing protein